MVDHLFCKCKFVGGVWYYIVKWIRRGDFAGNVVSLLNYFQSPLSEQ